jgi:hypothetical protein
MHGYDEDLIGLVHVQNVVLEQLEHSFSNVSGDV